MQEQNMEQASAARIFSIDPEQLTELVERRCFDESSDVCDFDSLLTALGLDNTINFSEKTKTELKNACQYHVRKAEDVLKHNIQRRMSAQGRRFSDTVERISNSRSCDEESNKSRSSACSFVEQRSSRYIESASAKKRTKTANTDEHVRSTYRYISKSHFGSNTIDYSTSPSFSSMLLENLQDSTLFLLICAGILSLGIGFYKFAMNIDKLAWIEGIAILLAVSGIVILSAGSQYSQERLFSTLQKESHSSTVKIRRNKIYDTVKSEDLAVGDVIYLEPGDIVAADCVLLPNQSCFCDESMISGESAAVKKSHFYNNIAKTSSKESLQINTRISQGHHTTEAESQASDSANIQDNENPQHDTRYTYKSTTAAFGNLYPVNTANSDQTISTKRNIVLDTSQRIDSSYFDQESHKNHLRSETPHDSKTNDDNIIKTVLNDDSKGASLHPLLHESPSIQKCNNDIKNLCTTKIDVPFLISGSYVVEGCAHALVLCVGRHSVQGKIFESMQKARNKTPLEIKINKLAQNLARKSFLLAFILLLGHAVKMLSAGSTIEYDKMLHGIVECISIVVMAVPEGLPMAITIALSIGTKRMLQDGLLVRHLAACETMNNCNIICVDKTGTLTHNQMTVKMVFSDNKIHRIGSHNRENSYIPSKRQRAVICNEMFILNASLNSSAFLNANKQFIGSQTEAALLRLLDENGCDFMGIRDQFTIVSRVPFSSDKKYMSTTVRFKDRLITFFKGAPEIICKFTEHAIVNSEIVPFEKTLFRNFLKKCDEKHIRTMALAYVVHSDSQCVQISNAFFRESDISKAAEPAIHVDGSLLINSEAQCKRSPLCDYLKSESELISKEASFYTARSSESNAEFIPQDLQASKNVSSNCSFKSDITKSGLFSGIKPSSGIFIAAVGLEDPLRADVSTKIQQCRRSGIIVVMLTGDKQSMAEALATKLGILEDGHVCLSGEEFRSMSALQLSRILPRIRVISRATPLDKQKYVQLMQKKGLIVAVTGDGSNDGPALKAADVGFGMGKSGTEVAKAASSVILINDNFASITKCIEWGQSINASVRKFIQYQLSVTCTAILIATVTLLFDKREDILFNPVYLLWINIIMDFFAALSLSTDYPLQNNVKKPEKPSTPIITKSMRYFIAFSTISISSIIFVLYYFTSMSNTLITNTFIYLLIFNQINARTLDHSRSVFKNMHKNKTFVISNLLIAAFQFFVTQKFNSVFKTEALSFNDFLLSAIIGFAILPMYTLFRYVLRSMAENDSETWIDIYKNINYELILAKSLQNKTFNA